MIFTRFAKEKLDRYRHGRSTLWGTVFVALTSILWLQIGPNLCVADDWPTLRHDQRRGAVSQEQLATETLVEAWSWQTNSPPTSAWPDAAKWDAYAKVADLRSMRNYDPVLHPIVVNDQVFLPSNVDDTVRCFRLEDGSLLWKFVADAPVRIALSFHEGYVFFGCDDGCVYCLKSNDGQLVWKRQLVPGADAFINDGRICSSMPIRSGVLIDSEQAVAIAAASLFPWQNTKLAAIELTSGEIRWERDLGTGWTLEGAMLLSPKHLVAPQGRSAPQLFDRLTGEPVGALPGGGGSFVLLTEDEKVYHGPGNKSGWITASDTANANSEGGKIEKISSFDNGTAVVVQDQIAFLLDDQRVAAFDRFAGEFLWASPCPAPHELILVGDTLFAGGNDEVWGFNKNSGKPVWRGIVAGRAMGLAAAGGRLLVATDTGKLTVFEPGPTALPPPELARLPTPATLTPAAVEIEPTDQNLVAPSRGPVLRFVEPGVAEVRWWTTYPQVSQLALVDGRGLVENDQADQLKTHHTALIKGLSSRSVAHYQIAHEIEGVAQSSPLYECDTHFDYTRPVLPPPQDAVALNQHAKPIIDIIDRKERRGLALVWGSQDNGLLAEGLCRQLGLDVCMLETSREKVGGVRERLLADGLYGRAINIRHVASLEELYLPAHAFDVVLCSDASIDADTLRKLALYVQPGGTLVVPSRVECGPLEKAGYVMLTDRESGDWQALRGPRLEGSASWTHMYGTAENTAYTGETLSGVREIDDLKVAWAGRPGPRYQSDRGNRKPSPLASGGRLYLQGFYRTIAMDAYNGTILWSLELPEVVRFNVPRDCSNWCVDQENVFIASEERCLIVDGATGEIRSQYEVQDGVAQANDEGLNWGYVARQSNALIGTGVRPNNTFTEFWGKEFWYDSKDGEHAKKVCSENIFSVHPTTGKMQWEHRGLIVNPTITMSNDQIFFVECRSEELLEGTSRRLDGDAFWNNLYLVALDLRSGKIAWQVPARPMPGESAFYMVYTDGVLLMQTSQGGKFALYAIDAKTGTGTWRGLYAWQTDHHGKHLSRPAIVDGIVYLRPLTLKLEDGSIISKEFPEGHQCGTYTCSSNALFMRAGSLAVWDRKTAEATRWDRLRPDCWISTIPAEGMLLSPEGGGGCSCGGWIETSIGFAPKWDELSSRREAR